MEFHELLIRPCLVQQAICRVVGLWAGSLGPIVMEHLGPTMTVSDQQQSPGTLMKLSQLEPGEGKSVVAFDPFI